MIGLRHLLRARTVVGAAGCALALAGSGCGGEISVADSDHATAELFNERCSGCHSLKAANAYGSKPQGQLEGGERTNSPNFNVRKEDRDDVLFAIRNGGFSGAIMPSNIVSGPEAEELAGFVSKYSGSEVEEQQAGGSSIAPRSQN